MAYVEGQPVSDVMKQCHSSSEQLDILKKCGEWLDAYHRSQTVEHRKFRPAHTIRYYDTLRERIKSGDHSVAARPLFMRGIKKLREIAPNYAGRDTIAAIQHGDFHLRNLVFDGTRIAGIDVSKDQPAVVGYDIAKILLDFTAVLRSREGLQTGQIIHRDTMDAFFDGYQLVKADDASVNFLLFARILATLNTIPASESIRTDAKERSLHRLRPLARHAFQSETNNIGKDTAKPVKFLLTKKSLIKARQGDHEFANGIRSILEPLGHKILFRRNTPHNRKILGVEELTFVHMSEPAGRNGLVFRRGYAGPFWHLERQSERWNWDVAKRQFHPNKIDNAHADPFFEKWKGLLLEGSGRLQQGGEYIYMPLQGKLLRRRSFQRMSPKEMIKVSLENTNLPIRATLHPSEHYSDEELSFLESIQSKYKQFEVADMPMHDALAACQFVVTQNSSAAFHALFHEKPAVLFAKIDFHHICLACYRDNAASVFDSALQARPQFRKYLYWYWKLNCIEFGAEDDGMSLRKRLLDLGWPIDGG